MAAAPQAKTEPQVGSAAGLLAGLRSERAAANHAEAQVLRLAVAWAAMHPAESLDDAAIFARRYSDDLAIPVAGPGAPLVAEFCVPEFAAAVGLPSEVGKAQLGEAVELKHRLPRTWARVDAEDLPAWRGRRIARATISNALTAAAAAFVDTQIAPFAHRVRPSQVDRLIEEAITRFMPEEARQRRRAQADGRHLRVHHHNVSFEGTIWVEGELDLADGLDLDAALAHGASQLKALGNTESLDIRRSLALGEMARRQLTLDLDTGTGTGTGTDPDAAVSTPGDQRPARPASKPREVVLYVHLSQSAITGHTTGTTGDLHLARVENTRTFLDADQIKAWCATPGAKVTVKPVIDLNEHVHVGAYEVPDRLAEANILLDHSCVFPWCTRPARSCDQDHVIPYAAGGPTSSDNLAPLCRRHHRLKTHTPWGYTVLDRGTYLWTSPHGYQFLRDHTGTLDVSRDLSRDRDPSRRAPTP